MKIMIIDDDRDLCLLTKKVLTVQGHQVDVFYDHISGVKHAKGNIPDLILMDVMMPGVSGPEIVKSMQTDPDLKDIPVIFLTGLVSGGEANSSEDGIRAGNTMYPAIGKPYDIAKLVSMINTAGRNNWKKR